MEEIQKRSRPYNMRTSVLRSIRRFWPLLQILATAPSNNVRNTILNSLSDKCLQAVAICARESISNKSFPSTVKKVLDDSFSKQEKSDVKYMTAANANIKRRRFCANRSINAVGNALQAV